ncbi:hypothetical protein [Roseomonas genomospecies 6]|nr:hypothetical protein [Roseomonas genomospecies 6]
MLLIDGGCTLGHLLRDQNGIGIVFHCGMCGRDGYIPLEPLIARFGPDRAVPTIFGRRSACGGLADARLD